MIVDDDDYEILKDSNIHQTKDGYCMMTVNGKRVYVHRYILNAPDEFVVDHINMNPLDNRKENLRLANRSQNHGNRFKPIRENPTSRFKGVFYDKQNKNWVTKIKYNTEEVFNGRFEDELSAAYAYNYYAKLYFKEFARLNDLPDVPEELWREKQLLRNFQKTKSGYHYVIWDKETEKWLCQVNINGKCQKLGRFEDVVEAALSANDFHLKNNLLKCKRAKKFNYILERDIKRMTEQQIDTYNKQLEMIKDENN